MTTAISKAASIMGKVKSDKKTASSRENGKKGGRPKNNITKAEFLNQYIMPHVVLGDKAYNRQLFNDTKDLLHKDGLITDKQAENWIYPNTQLFE